MPRIDVCAGDRRVGRRVGLAQRANDRRDVGLCLRRADVRSQPADQPEKSRVPDITPRILLPHERDHDIRVANRRDEPVGEHADDGVALAIEHHLLAERAANAAEPPDPQPMADDCHLPGRVVGRERPTERDGGPEHLEERSGRLHSLQPLGFAAGEVCAPLKRGDEGLEGARPTSDVDEVRNRERLLV